MGPNNTRGLLTDCRRVCFLKDAISSQQKISRAKQIPGHRQDTPRPSPVRFCSSAKTLTNDIVKPQHRLSQYRDRKTAGPAPLSMRKTSVGRAPQVVAASQNASKPRMVRFRFTTPEQTMQTKREPSIISIPDTSSVIVIDTDSESDVDMYGSKEEDSSSPVQNPTPTPSQCRRPVRMHSRQHLRLGDTFQTEEEAHQALFQQQEDEGHMWKRNQIKKKDGVVTGRTFCCRKHGQPDP